MLTAELCAHLKQKVKMYSMKENIQLVAEAMVDEKHRHAADTREWLKNQLLKVPAEALQGMVAILLAGDWALNDEDYCEHEADLIWRHCQCAVLCIIRNETGIGEEGNPIPTGLHLSPECPCCDEGGEE